MMHGQTKTKLEKQTFWDATCLSPQAKK